MAKKLYHPIEYRYCAIILEERTRINNTIIMYSYKKQKEARKTPCLKYSPKDYKILVISVG